MNATRLSIVLLLIGLLTVGCAGPSEQKKPDDEVPVGNTAPDEDNDEGNGVVGKGTSDEPRELTAEELMGPYESAKEACEAMASEMSEMAEEVDAATCELGESGLVEGPARASGKGPWLGAQTVVLRGGGMSFLSLLAHTDAGWFGMPGIALSGIDGDGVSAKGLRFEVANVVGDDTDELVLEFEEEEDWEEERDGEPARFRMSHTSQVLCGLDQEMEASCIRIPVSWTSVVTPKSGEQETSVTELTILTRANGTLEISGDTSKLSEDGQEIANPFIGIIELTFP